MILYVIIKAIVFLNRAIENLALKGKRPTGLE